MKIDALLNPSDYLKLNAHAGELLSKFMESDFQQYPPLPTISEKELLHKWEAFFKTPNVSLQDFMDQLFQYSLNLHHRKSFGHQMAFVLPFIAVIETLVRFLNNASGLFDVGPSANTLERFVIKKLIKKFNFPEKSGGVLVSGGTAANLSALLCARQAFQNYDVWKNGYPKNKQLAVMVSEHAHYSIDRIVRMMGLGSEGIILVPTDERLKIRVDLLEEIFLNAKKNGKEIFSLVGMAGATSNGSFDDLDAMADFCDKHQLWLHVDGAHGGALQFSNEYQHVLKGIERVSSVCFNFHKLLFSPALTSVLLFKNKSDMHAAFSQDAPYLHINEDDRNIIEYSFECTKPAMAVPIYAILKFLDEKEISDYISSRIKLAKDAAQLIKNNLNFELFSEPECNIVCFRMIKNGIGDENLNDLNYGVYKKILERGDFYITKTVLNKKVYLRLSLMNPITTLEDIQEFLEVLLKMCK